MISLLSRLNFAPSKDSDLTNQAKYDILCCAGKRKFSVEVKHDMMAEKTGNVAIEVWNPKLDKPSGVNISQSDLWFHLIPDGENITCWFCSTLSLRKYSEEVKPKRVIEVGGDCNATLFLYSIEQIIDNLFVRLDNVSDKEASKLIKGALK